MIYSLITWRQPDIRASYHRYLAGIAEDAHEFEAEKCRLSGANSAQGTSKTKIVLSFPIHINKIYKRIRRSYTHEYNESDSFN